MSETKRSVAVALGLFILIALVVYFTFTTISAQNSNYNLQNQNNQLQTWLNGNETLLNETQDNATNLQNIVNLNESEVVWTENNIIYLPSSALVLGPYHYAGYISVKISATADTSVELTYTFQSLNYTSQVDCGTDGTAIFPVMPMSSPLTIRPWPTTPPPAGTTANWTWTYYY